MIERYNQEMKQYIQQPTQTEKTATEEPPEPIRETAQNILVSEDSLLSDVPYPLSNEGQNAAKADVLEQQKLPPYPTDAVGFLQIQATTARNVLPVENAAVSVVGEVDGKPVLYRTVFTDNSGFSPIMSLPAVSANLSLTPEAEIPYITYTIRVTKDGFYPVENTKVPIFEGITSRQPVYLIPLPESMQRGDWQVFPDNGPTDL